MILLKIDETDPTVEQWLSVDIKVNKINVTALISSWTNPVNHLEGQLNRIFPLSSPNDTDTHAARSHAARLIRLPFLTSDARAHIIIMQTDTYNLHGGTWFENANDNKG
jgi:hypothetical protein